MRTKRYARKYRPAANKLLDKEEEGRLQDKDVENFKKMIGRDPKKNSVVKRSA